LKRIGFIGLGLMGSGMTMNILKAGFPLTVWNRTASRAEPIVKAGAKLAKSPKEVAEKSDIVISIVTDSKDVEEVLLGQNGVIYGVKPGTIVIDMSTISPIRTREMAAKFKEKGIKMLDAPVSGGDMGENGTLYNVGDRASERPGFHDHWLTTYPFRRNGDGQILQCTASRRHCNAGARGALVFREKGVDPKRCISAGYPGGCSWHSQKGRSSRGDDHEPCSKVNDYLKTLRIIMEQLTVRCL